jgi:hypothetical protein
LGVDLVAMADDRLDDPPEEFRRATMLSERQEDVAQAVIALELEHEIVEGAGDSERALAGLDGSRLLVR